MQTARSAAHNATGSAHGFSVGDIVRVQEGGSLSELAVVKGFYDDIQGGVFLDRHVFGFRSWNVTDLHAAEQGA